MEERNPVSFSRLLSDESTISTLSADSCEYYQTEIFDQLPSVQATRAEQNRPEEQLGHGHLTRGPRDKASMQPLRSLAMCIQGKRDARQRRKMQTSNIGFWESWRRSQSIYRKRAWEQLGGALASLLPWQHTLRTIQGRFGIGVKAYFVFLRYLIFLNILYCALIWGFILGPTTFYGRSNNSEPLKFGENDSVLDFVMGTGYLNRSSVFVAFYRHGCLDFTCLNTPLLYLAGILTILFLSAIMVVRRTIVGYKHTWMLGKRYSMNVTYKIFCGWDFTIQCPTAATLERSFIRNDLKLFLEEQRFSMREARRTFRQWAHLYLLRFNLNLLVLSLLSGAFYLIYFATDKSQSQSQRHMCRENEIGREMYKLCIFNFLTTFCNAFLLNYPRKVLQEKYPSSLLARLSGKQHFLIPFNVLDLVYIQTVSWVGVYYCPLLPLIGIVILIMTLYIKKFTVLRCCVAEQRMIRASNSSVLFHFMLLLGLLMAATTLSIEIFLSGSFSSSSCSPFGEGKTVFNATEKCVKSLPSLAQSTLHYLASEAFAIPLLLAEIIILTSYMSRRRANQKAIERLKDMLVMSSSDKRFLVKQHTTMLRRHKNPRQVRSAGFEEDVPLSHYNDPTPHS
ncbi:transmembrane channel-like protein 7 isoform X2 [Thunnus maccoyii]|uniref:transmembrane channel-like protein 7 isoform X2 n=1 Tax=Thunnus maccoyii TaxID=8240 RepID=UPI001C4BEF57|nr:transmembrane channel-like protein 7 isoform X2 [Thunnus maccoyii]